MNPRKVAFCWWCGKKLWNKNKAQEKIIDGHTRVLHAQCAENRGYDEQEGNSSQEDRSETCEELSDKAQKQLEKEFERRLFGSGAKARRKST